MQQFSYNEFKNLEISPYQIYSLDLDYQQYYSIQNYLKNKTDEIDKDQKLNIMFIDIEVYTANANVNIFKNLDMGIAKFPINAITIYSTFDKTFRAYYLLQHVNLQKFPTKEEYPNLIQSYVKDLADDKYINQDEKLEMYIFSNELDLIKACWSKVRDIDPTILSGWNSDEFDLPYIYFRLGALLNSNEVEIGKILTQFGKIKVEKFNGKNLVKIPEYPVLDLMFLYKPREDNGLVI